MTSREAGAAARPTGPFTPFVIALGALVMLLLGVNLGKLLGGDQQGDSPPGSALLRVVPAVGGSESSTGQTAAAAIATAAHVPCPEKTDTLGQDKPQGAKTAGEAWSVLSERLMRPLRVHSLDGSISPNAARWYGAARESMPEGLSKRDADRWRRFPGPAGSFFPASRDAALEDPRGESP
jgi:hypothetical protein